MEPVFILSSVHDALLHEVTNETRVAGLDYRGSTCICACIHDEAVGKSVWVPDGLRSCGLFLPYEPSKECDEGVEDFHPQLSLRCSGGALQCFQGGASVPLEVIPALDSLAIEPMRIRLDTNLSATKLHGQEDFQVNAACLQHPDFCELFFIQSSTHPNAVQPFLASPATSSPGPVLTYDAAPATHYSIPLQLDSILYVPQSSSEHERQEACRCSLRAILQDVSSSVQALIAQADGTPPSGVTIAPFELPSQGVPLMVLLPLVGTGNVGHEERRPELLKFRQLLHIRTLCPCDQPLFRLCQRMSLGPSEYGRGLLKDVHKQLGASPINGGKSFGVSGSLLYHHYLQDGFDDRGWGCAYRSFQTLWSWFRLQGYTGYDAPTHREIQRTLATLGDKPMAFVGSKEWIGAVELGLVLQEYLAVDYRILSVRQGKEMPSLARQIAEHFCNEGTPVMVGGGVLAYTLLGLDWNEDTQDVAFLILDPHYVGPDDVASVVKGSWVSWKQLGDKAAAGGPLFQPSEFYNLLCPQRPREL